MRWGVSVFFLLAHSFYAFGFDTKALPAYTTKVFPSSILMLNETFSHHVLVAEKATHKLHLFTHQNGLPIYVKSYEAATGKRTGNKINQGDLKTPEGIFNFTRFIPGEDLIKKYGLEQGQIYGAGAFVMDYPNPFDKLRNKTGGGIWLHSTNDNSRINKGLDSKGCVVMIDENLKDISKYIELYNTPIVVVENLNYLPGNTWKKNQEDILETVMSWKEAWATENAKEYFSHYSRNYQDPLRGNFANFKSYKKAVFSSPGKPELNLSKVSILREGKTSVVKFIQHYQSNSIMDKGIKTLYLTQNNDYQWKIIKEVWQKMPAEMHERKVAFKPSMRFFEVEN